MNTEALTFKNEGLYANQCFLQMFYWGKISLLQMGKHQKEIFLQCSTQNPLRFCLVYVML